MLTSPGPNWPSRVATSLLRNVDMPWMVTHTKLEFEDLAVRLANDQGGDAGEWGSGGVGCPWGLGAMLGAMLGA